MTFLLRTLALQFASAFEAATHLHDHALSTRVGSEAVVRSLQAACDGDPSLAVLSVDGVGAFDLISRPCSQPSATPPTPMPSCFYDSPSEFVWTAILTACYRQRAASKVIRLCRPYSHSVSRCRARLAWHLRGMQADLLPNENLRAFLDDT